MHTHAHTHTHTHTHTHAHTHARTHARTHTHTHTHTHVSHTTYIQEDRYRSDKQLHNNHGVTRTTMLLRFSPVYLLLLLLLPLSDRPPSSCWRLCHSWEGEGCKTKEEMETCDVLVLDERRLDQIEGAGMEAGRGCIVCVVSWEGFSVYERSTLNGHERRTCLCKTRLFGWVTHCRLMSRTHTA